MADLTFGDLGPEDTVATLVAADKENLSVPVNNKVDAEIQVGPTSPTSVAGSLPDPVLLREVLRRFDGRP